MKNIIIFGSSRHSKVVMDIVEKENKYRIVGLLDRFRTLNDETLGYRVIGSEDNLVELVHKYDVYGGLIAIGDNWTRYIMYKKILEVFPGFNFVTAVHPSAQIGKHVKIGHGTVIMAGAAIDSNSSIGDFCILNTNSTLSHDGNMHNFSSIAPGATLAGNVDVGEFSAVSLGANIIQDVKIGNHTVVGAGALVLKDIPDHKVAYGMPAKVIRDRKEGERYL